jgi:hypothetical protein
MGRAWLLTDGGATTPENSVGAPREHRALRRGQHAEPSARQPDRACAEAELPRFQDSDDPSLRRPAGGPHATRDVIAGRPAFARSSGNLLARSSDVLAGVVGDVFDDGPEVVIGTRAAARTFVVDDDEVGPLRSVAEQAALPEHGPGRFPSNVVLRNPLAPKPENHLAGIKRWCVRRIDLELTACHLASRARAHVTEDVDRVDMLLGLHRLPRWLAEDSAQLRRGLLPLGSSKTLGSNDELTVGRDGDDQFGHDLFASEPDTDGDGSVGCDLALDAGLITTPCLLGQLVSLRTSIRGAQGR